MEIPICPAENPDDMSYENYSAVQLNRKKIAKNEDDGEDLDAASGDDDDDGDECGNDKLNVDDSAFVARISCLMASIERHIKAILGNVNKIETQVGNLKSKGTNGKCKQDKEPTPKTKCFKQSKYFQDKEWRLGQEKHNQEDFKVALGQKLENNPIHTKLLTQNKEDISLPGLGIQSLNKGLTTFPSGAKMEYIKSDLKTIWPAPIEHNPKPYEEYEARLRRLMANRDAIERNVVKMLGPRHGERM
ncbi:hypothetical protein KR059_009306 [Drosophila kikkawai]|nr:hypothetical protein KR059_009306 [Drosophila kikkawai]